MTVPVHPIEAESYRLLAERCDLSHLEAGPRAVLERVLHATADFSFVDSLVAPPASVAAGVTAIRAGAPVVVDVEMVRAGISGVRAECRLDDARRTVRTERLTLSAAAMRLAAAEHAEGAVFAVGCAPTALEELVSLCLAGDVRPALVVGVPVGLVGAAEAKQRLRDATAIPSVSNVGARGGSAVAAAIVNALVRLAAA